MFDNGFDPQQTDKLLPDLPGDTPLPWMWCPDSGGTGVCAEGTDSPHNIREDHKLFYSGVAVSDRPDFERFFSAGKFRYYCELHGARRAAWTDWSA